MNRELHRDAALLQLIVELTDFVLRLRDRHAVAGNDHDQARLLEHLGGALDRLRLVDFLLAGRLSVLHLTEGTEQHVRERSVHRVAHDDGEDETARPVERTGGDEQLVVEHESHRHGGQAGVRIEDGDDGRHVGPANRDDEQHAEEERERDDAAEHERRPRRRRTPRDRAGERQREAEQREVADVLERVRDRPLRHPFHFLQLARRHQAARQRQVAEDDLGDERDHPERRQVFAAFRQPQVVLRGADEAGGRAAERVRERRPLRHRRERHLRQRHADDEAGGDRDDDPRVVNDRRFGPCDDDGDHRAGDARVHAFARRRRGVHPVQREDEQRRRDQVPELADAVDHEPPPDLAPGSVGGRLSVLNILSIRSVIRKPLTMFVIEAKSAMAPSARIRGG